MRLRPRADLREHRAGDVPVLVLRFPAHVEQMEVGRQLRVSSLRRVIGARFGTRQGGQQAVWSSSLAVASENRSNQLPRDMICQWNPFPAASGSPESPARPHSPRPPRGASPWQPAKAHVRVLPEHQHRPRQGRQVAADHRTHRHRREGRLRRHRAVDLGDRRVPEGRRHARRTCASGSRTRGWRCPT